MAKNNIQKHKQWSRKTLHRKLEQHEPHYKPVVNTGVPEG